MTDRVQEVRFSQADATVQKEGIISCSRLLCYRQRSRVCQAVTCTHDERVKGVPHVEWNGAVG